MRIQQVYCKGIALTVVQLKALNALYEKQGEPLDIKINNATRRRFIIEDLIVPVRDRGYALTRRGVAVCEMFAKHKPKRKDNICPACGEKPRAYATGAYCRECTLLIGKRNRLKRHFVERHLSSST
jgi:hypothetical protein